MLVLSRKRDERIVIGDNIVITIVDVRGDKVRVGSSTVLKFTEVRLAVVDEDLRDSPSGLVLDDLVGVEEGHVECLGDQASDRRLAGAHRADQHHPGGHLNLSVPR